MIRKPRAALAVFVVLVGVSIVAVLFVDQSLRPELKQRDVLVHMEAPPGTSLARMDEIAAQTVFDVGSLQGVSTVTAHVGRAIRSDQIVNVNSAEIWAKIDPAADYGSTLSAIEAAVDVPQEVTSQVQTYSEQRVTEILGRSADELVVRVYGSNPTVLRDSADQLRGAMESLDGVSTASVDMPLEQPTIEVDVDLDRAQAVGLKPGDIRRRAATLLGGIVVGNLFEEQKVFDVVVWGAPAIRQTTEDVENMLIPTPAGTTVTLADVADVRVVPNATVIRHESVESFLDVTANIEGRGVGDVAADVESLLTETPLPLEYHAEVLGGFADERQARSRVIAVIVAALIGIFVFLQAAFSSWRLALLVFATLPLALSGGVLAILVTGNEASLGSIAGLVAVVALATRGTVLLIRHYEERERLGDPFGEELIINGTTELLVPTVVPVIALAALLVPLAVASPLAGMEIVGPMAFVLIGGLTTTLLLTLVVVPAAYLRWGFIEEPDTTAADLFDRDQLQVPVAGD